MAVDPDAAGKAALGSSADSSSLLVKLAIDTPRTVLIQTLNSLIEQFNKLKPRNGSVGTAQFKPTIISSAFTPTASRYSKTTTDWGAITNAAMSYTAGSTPEKLLLTIGSMANKATSGIGEVALYVDGVRYGIQMYYNTGVPWYRGSAAQPPLKLAAGQTVALALWAFSSDTAGFDITTESPQWLPTISGYAIYDGQ